MDKKEYLKKLENLDPEEAAILKEYFSEKKKDDPDLIDQILKLESRITILEKEKSSTPPKKDKGFFSLFD